MRPRLQRDPVLTGAMLLFAAGLLALAVMFALFATGHRGLPMWLSLSSLLLPLGLAVGVVRTRRQSRLSQRSQESHQPDRPEQPADD
jgi:membrane protein implicated in regulation of membrane protease activity